VTPELGIENANKHLCTYLSMMTREDALVFINRLRKVLDSLEAKVLRGEPVKRRQKSRQG